MAKTSDDVLLRIIDMDAGYGHVNVIRKANISVNRGEVVGLVGRNGAGKTTFISAVAGLITAKSGSILLNGAEISGVPANRRRLRVPT